MKNVFFVFISFILLLGISGCSAGEKTTSQAKSSGEGGTLIIGIESEADVLDPHRAGGWVTFRINRQIHESLVSEDLSQSSSEVAVPQLKPGLAESWEVSEDGLTYIFNLRQGVKFHDGTDFNAEAVEFNIRRVWDKNFEYYDNRSAGQMEKTYQSLKEVNVLDDYKIEFVLSKPFSPFLRMLAQGSMGSGGILSPAALEKWGNDQYAEHPVGTGPFKFLERERGNKIELVKNEEYWGEKPNIDGVIFRPISDSAARVMALETGEVDIIAVPPPDSVDGLQEKGFKIEEGTPPHVWYLSLNFNNPIMQVKEVRQAIAMSINREGMAKELLRDTANAAYSIQSPANEAYDPEFVDYEYNPEKAKELLAKAGYADGFDMIFQTSIDGSGQLIPVPMAEWIQSDLAKVGINVKLETYEWVSYLSLWTQGMESNVGFNQMSWGFTTPYYLSIIAHSDSGANAGKYSSSEVDSMIEKAITTINQEEANQYWREANKLLAEDAAIIPIVSDKAPYAMADYVEGFFVPSQEWYDLIQVKLTN